jgi:hypothetical protein
MEIIAPGTDIPQNTWTLYGYKVVIPRWGSSENPTIVNEFYVRSVKERVQEIIDIIGPPASQFVAQRMVDMTFLPGTLYRQRIEEMKAGLRL